jgi:hypothetical protein
VLILLALIPLALLIGLFFRLREQREWRSFAKKYGDRDRNANITLERPCWLAFARRGRSTWALGRPGVCIKTMTPTDRVVAGCGGLPARQGCS